MNSSKHHQFSYLDISQHGIAVRVQEMGLEEVGMGKEVCLVVD
jgi:hypothetical protein